MQDNHAAYDHGMAVRPRVFRTGGWVIFVGVWFLLLGVGLTALCGAMVVLAGDQLPFALRVGLLTLAALPLAAAALGVLMTFGGERIAVDPRDREVEIAYGRWWTWRRETKPFDAFEAVEIHQQTTRIGVEREGRRSHPVRLVAAGDEVELAAPRSERRARALAEEVANLTGLPMRERSVRGTTERAAGTLDESVADRARRMGEDVQWPRLSKSSAIVVTNLGDETSLDLPRPSRKMMIEGVLALAFLLALYGGALGGMAYGLQNQLEEFGVLEGQFWPALIWALPLVPVAYILVFGVLLLVAQERVIVSPRSFKRVWRLPVGQWTRRIAAQEIEALTADSDDVVVRTDRTKCRVGYTLDKRSRRWLRDAIRYLLIHGTPPAKPRASK